MKKILISLMAIALVVGLVGVGIFASFSDTETSSGNTFTAGTLDLKVDGNDDPNVVALDIEPMAPGATGYNTWAVTNTGNIAGDFTLTVGTISDDPGTTPEPEAALGTDLGELSSKLMVILFEDTNNNGALDVGETALYSDGMGGMAVLSGMPSTYNPSNPTVGGGSTVYITLMYELPTNTGNEVMDDSSTFDITFSLVQS